MTRERLDAARLVGGVGAVGAVTLAFARWLPAANTATISTTLLMVVLVVAATSRLWVAITTSFAAVLAFNFAFLPPVGTFTIADPQNWVALASFLAVSIVASNLSAVAKARASEAIGRRDELARLFDLSRDVLVGTESREALATLARSVARRFDLDYVAVALPRDEEWDIYDAGASMALDTRELASAFAAAQTTLEFDAYARTYAGHRTMATENGTVRLVPLRVGTRPIGLLAAAGRPVEPGTLDALAGVVAIGIERAQFLEERKAGALTRQSEQLKTALLASLGHDLRTPLTAIRVAAANLQAGTLAEPERREQTELIQAEVERLQRLFQNILEMARLDAGGVATEPRPAHPSEIVAAARDQVEHALRPHRVAVATEPDVPVRVDPRVTASALAHVLENAAQYSPPGSTIDVTASTTEAGLRITVDDRGPGIAPADLPRLFERFYRGEASRGRTSGSGMGLWIARGLLAVEGGQVWAENRPDGGARFTLFVPEVSAGTGTEPS
jgi:two-component system sensor histidine kinase KdpD